MQNIETIHDYLRSHSEEIGARILSSYPSLHSPGDSLLPLVSDMLRTPYPAQALAIMGIRKRWQSARNANVIVTFSKSWPGRPYFGLIGPGQFLV
jgi:hypothetical protein